MTHFIKTTITVMLVSLACSTVIADDLFSEVTISSVFGGDKEVAKSEVAVSNGRRVTGPSSLRKLLADAGLKGQEVNDKSVAVQLDAPQTKDKSLSAVVAVNVDKERIVIAFPLVKVTNANSAKLLELMAAGNSGEGIYFFYEVNTKWLGVRRNIRNQNVSSSWLKSQLDEMVVVAQERVDAWQSLGKTLLEDNKEATTPQVQAPQVKTTPAKATMDGSWKANGTSGESYVLSFRGNQFSLAIATGGKKVKSTGTWTLQGGQLTLSGEGLTLTGSVKASTSTQFELTLTNRSPLTFSKNG